MTLYTYVLRYDDGAAPNPYWGMCTLAICKPAIRRTAKQGDWVVGLGSANSPIGNVANRVVYAMKVIRVLSLREYDDFCSKKLKEKIPDWNHADFRRKVGDCIYDYSRPGKPRLREGVHKDGNRETDLGGKNVLLSDRFYYFGDRPIELPDALLPIVHSTQGHKSHANDSYLDAFVSWIEGLEFKKNVVLAEPQLKKEILSMDGCPTSCAADREREDREDDIC